MGLLRKRQPDRIAQEIAEQHARSERVLERVERVLRNAAAIEGTHDAAAIDAYSKAESERTTERRVAMDT